ncbi:galactosyldiacylglycerol synthase [Streptomyces diacarni]|uniref:Galactosyldiacylglycerol synthase n=1 Tax=Streptomyces diacarni TaxID=2800381 RepID=A0A367EYF7_9ACTN|nr:galactosyldiacylglycerol synthase [Streptomyces diacarni]RCG23178.1 galactosyldiacylglycerol synthase [Streptomyces diacarni]
MPHRFLLLSAGMGAGHDAVAHELAHRLRARGHHTAVRDILTLLPAGTGRALRTGYRATVRHLPGLYGAVYAGFLATEPATPGPRPSSAPLAALAERPLLRTVAQWRPDVVVPTFHLSAQVTGRLRARGALSAPAAVVVVDFAVHRGWLHSGNDLHLCVTEGAARQVCAATGRRAYTTGPVVPADFFAPADPDSHWRAQLARHTAASPGRGASPAGRPAVLLSTGAWGVGTRLLETARHLTDHGCLPVLLCGNDEGLRRRAAGLPGVLPLGWVTDLPELMAVADVLLDNAAGQTAAQALAAGLPVVGHRPLPGHAVAGVRAMARAGLSRHAHGAGEPARTVRVLAAPGPVRSGQIAAARAAFRNDAALELERLAASPEARGR